MKKLLTFFLAVLFWIFVFCLLFPLAACGNGRLDILGQRVVSFSQSDILVVNNMRDTILRELTISNGHFCLEDRGDGVLTAPEVSTGETIAGEIGYFGRGGYGQIELSAKVYRASDGLYIGLARHSFSVGGGHYYGGAGDEQKIWEVNTFDPVKPLREVPAEVYYNR